MGRKSGSTTALKSVKSEETTDNTIVNPFRDGSSAAFVFAALVKGGTIDGIAKASVKNHPVKPRHDQDDEQAHALAEGKLRVKDAMRRARNDGLTVDGPDENGNVKISA